jgi:hypothetical protein
MVMRVKGVAPTPELYRCYFAKRLVFEDLNEKEFEEWLRRVLNG